MKTFDHEIFCEKVYELFKDEKQESVAKKLGIKQGYVSDIKNKKAKAPSLDLIIRIADEYKISVDYLLGLTDVQTRDLQTKELCNALGLSEDAIWTLKIAKDLWLDFDGIRVNQNDTISDFLSSTYALSMFGDLCVMQWHAIMNNNYSSINYEELTGEEGDKRWSEALDIRDQIELNMFRASKNLQNIADEMIEKSSSPSAPEDDIKAEIIIAQMRKNIAEMLKRRKNEKS